MRKLFIFIGMLLLNITAYAQNYTKVTIAAAPGEALRSVKIFYPEGDTCDWKGVKYHLIQEGDLNTFTKMATFEFPLQNPGPICFAADYSTSGRGGSSGTVYSGLERVENIVSSVSGEINAYWLQNDFPNYRISFAREVVGYASVYNAGNKRYAFTFFLPSKPGTACQSQHGGPIHDELKIDAGNATQVALPRLPADADQFELVCLQVRSSGAFYTHGPYAITPTSNAFTIHDSRNVTQNPVHH